MITFNYDITKLFLLNKLVIPAILVATVMVAGIFAFSPVQSASTVHGTISDDYDTLLNVICDEVDTSLGSYNADEGSCEEFFGG